MSEDLRNEVNALEKFSKTLPRLLPEIVTNTHTLLTEMGEAEHNISNMPHRS